MAVESTQRSFRHRRALDPDAPIVLVCFKMGVFMRFGIAPLCAPFQARIEACYPARI